MSLGVGRGLGDGSRRRGGANTCGGRRSGGDVGDAEARPLAPGGGSPAPLQRRDRRPQGTDRPLPGCQPRPSCSPRRRRAERDAARVLHVRKQRAGGGSLERPAPGPDEVRPPSSTRINRPRSAASGWVPRPSRPASGSAAQRSARGRSPWAEFRNARSAKARPPAGRRGVLGRPEATEDDGGGVAPPSRDPELPESPAQRPGRDWAAAAGPPAEVASGRAERTRSPSGGWAARVQPAGSSLLRTTPRVSLTASNTRHAPPLASWAASRSTFCSSVSSVRP